MKNKPKTGILSSIFLIFFLVSCLEFPSDLVLPEWDTELNLPLLNREYKLSDIIEDSEYLIYDSSSGQLIYRLVSDTLKNISGVKDFLKNKLNGNYDFEVPVINGKGSIQLPVDNASTVDSAHFSNGTIEFNIKNNTTTNLEFEIVLPQFKDKNGNSFSTEGFTYPHNTFESSYNLKNFSFSSLQYEERDRIIVDIKTGSGFTGETIQIFMSIKDTEFDYLSGKIKPLRMGRIERSIELPVSKDIERMRNKLTLEDPLLQIQALYKSRYQDIFSVIFENVRIFGKTKEGSLSYLTDKSGNQNLGDLLLIKGRLTKEYSSENSSIADFLSFLPDSLFISADVYMNPFFENGTASDKDAIEMKTFFSVSGISKIDSIKFVDTISFDFEENTRDAIRNTKNLELNYEIDNGVPLAGMIVSSINDSIHFEKFGRNINLESAIPINANSETQSVITKSSFIIDSIKIDKLSKSDYMLVTWSLFTQNSTYSAKFSPNQKIKLKANCSINYHVKP